MDHPVDDERANRKQAKIEKIDAVRMSFSEQMGAFLRRNLTWFLVAGLTLLVLHDIFGTHGVLAMRRSQNEATDIQRETNQLNEENQKLQDRVKALRSDPAEIERVAREDMGLARPGEYIFRIQPRSGDSKPAAQPGQPVKKP